MAQLEHIEAIEARLWSAADTLRSNSNYASNEYFLPVMGLLFLRHAYSRYLKVLPEVQKSLPSRGGVVRSVTKEDFSGRGAIYLRPEAQFDFLVSLPDGADRVAAVIGAMESIEKDYEGLANQLPKQEYRELTNEVIAGLLRTLNPDELKKADGDVFGRIYEYFLTEFAGLKAHDGGEFFTPVSLVQLIANFLEPTHGIVLDPACGSGGMFVQSAHFVERQHLDVNRTLTFYGMEKNPTTIRLAKMNLAVHGLEGKIAKAITYYEDPHEGLHGQADYVMANPPFNVDEVDAERVGQDSKRLPFGLPGTNKAKKVSNGNYLWISYFYSYLAEKGRAGFVMSSQASSAGGDERLVRQKIIETGHVDVMVDIRGNFFYTRTVPCQLWFFDKGKPVDRQDQVLMIDARQVFRQVNRTICDFSPEQAASLTAIVWLYRGEQERFVGLVRDYAARALKASQSVTPVDYFADFAKLLADAKLTEGELAADRTATVTRANALVGQAHATRVPEGGMPELVAFTDGTLHQLSEAAKTLLHDLDRLSKALSTLADTEAPWARGRNSPLKALEAGRQALADQLKDVRYRHKVLHWLTSRFPQAQLVAVPGLVKVVTRDELKANDSSLTPGRYVGVAPEAVDENFDFEETMATLKAELITLNAEANDLSAKVLAGLEGLGV